ncbi:MAG: response regulator [Candidatus Electrothrix sp. GW3-4]|uniref:ATP-binding response regulator n=1 Tax=Candidatus Electrothrix sp. GW3-4 TaxID=3126740 RepID=UPI0030D48786
MTNGNKRILIIDDDHDIWKSYQLVLQAKSQDESSSISQLNALLQEEAPQEVPVPLEETFGFELSYAAQGEEGYEMVKQAIRDKQPFAIAFVDIRMPPGWDGMETATHIRQFDPDIEIVIVTAYSDRSREEIARTVGALHKLLFFRKPFDPDELMQVAVSLCDKWNTGKREDEQRRELQIILDTSPAAIFSIDQEGRIIAWNQAAEKITGYLAAEVQGKFCIFYKISEDPICHTCAALDAFKKGGAERELKITSKDGAKKIISLSVSQAILENEQGRRQICSFWDITDLKEGEKALAESNQRLKEKIASNERLQAESLRLQQELHQAQKMEAIGLMAGGVAHDLNNILASIVGYPQLIKFQLPDNKQVHELAQAVEESGVRAAAVVDDLLTVARGVAVVKQVADLNQLVEEYLVSPEAKEILGRHPKVTLSSNLDSQSLYISCSSIHITKCLMNLVNNAAEAIGGAGEIVISTTCQEVAEALGCPAYKIQPWQYAVLSVRDNGPGISEEDQERVFEPFYTKKIMGRSGTGLGLAVVWNTVLDHSGSVSVSSTEGEGTCFTLLFPLTDEEPSQVQKVEPGLEELTGSARIMVVDDDVRQLNLAGGMLKVLGYEVIKASSGEEALPLLADQPVDLLVLDMLMPGMNGRHTYEEAKKLYPALKAVISSGFAADQEVQKTQELGAGSFVKKPYTLKQLGLAVRNELSNIPQGEEEREHE